MRSDGVNPDLLGMKKIVSEDSVRRALIKMEESWIEWLKKHLKKCYVQLLNIPWILDVDTTVKVFMVNRKELYWVITQKSQAGLLILIIPILSPIYV